MIRFMIAHPTENYRGDPDLVKGVVISMRFFDWRRFRMANNLNQYSRREYGSLLLVRFRKVDPWR